jgi:hypothetical protein
LDSKIITVQPSA